MTTLCRAFNVVCSALGLVALWPLFLFVAIAIECDDHGPVFYLQSRIGRGFEPFRLVKFRSMKVGADVAGLLTAPSDQRITRVGRILRRYKLDELPQLWNVLKGEMQLVGPRPEVETYVAQFRQEYSLLLQEPPGITDPASLAFRHEEQMLVAGQIEKQYLAEILPEKLRLSLDYQQGRSFHSDLRVLLKTILRVAA